MKSKAKWLDRRVAALGPYLTLCLSPEEFALACLDLGVTDRLEWVTDGADATMHTLSAKDGKVACVVCIRNTEGRDPISIAGLLVHEAVHVWQGYAARIGERNPGDEQEAYAVQLIAQELMQAYAARLAGIDHARAALESK